MRRILLEKLILLFPYLLLIESFRMQDIVKNVTLFNGTSFDIVRKAIDRDHFTYAQVEEGMSLSIILNQRTNFSCFYMEARGGDYEIYISKDAKRIGELCRSLSITQDIVSPHSYRFCCNYDMNGEMLTVMKTDKGSLRLFEIETQECNEHMTFLKNCSGCSGVCNECLQVDDKCISCTENPDAEGCSYFCTKDCAPGKCRENKTCSMCKPGYYGATCQKCQNGTLCGKDCSENGDCLRQCTEGLFGSNCDKNCSTHCKNCLLSADNCTECYHGIPPYCSNKSQLTSEQTMTMMVAGGGGLLILTFLFICFLNIIRRLCVTPPIHSYGFIETQDNEMLPLPHSHQYTDPEPPDDYINTSHRLSVDEFLICVPHKKLNHGLQREFKRIPHTMTDSYDAAVDPKNKSRNRYKNVYPYDFSRVVLDTSDIAGSGDYINACFVNGLEKRRAYIAAQGPFTEETVLDFWRMIWQMRSVKIVMLTNLLENGKMKCIRYWPNTETRIGPFIIRTENHNTSRRYTIRHITIRKGIEVRHVTQYQYTDWFTTRVPANVDSILMFRNLLNCDISDTDGPIIIHCSSGTGRTGTFIALDYLLYEGTKTGTVDVEGCIRALRQQRAYAVQSTDEYVFLHDALFEGFSCAQENGIFEMDVSV